MALRTPGGHRGGCRVLWGKGEGCAAERGDRRAEGGAAGQSETLPDRKRDSGRKRHIMGQKEGHSAAERRTLQGGKKDMLGQKGECCRAEKGDTGSEGSAPVPPAAGPSQRQ